jgi:ApbE superfamily uncharacterized protein (UPF0280 family)
MSTFLWGFFTGAVCTAAGWIWHAQILAKAKAELLAAKTAAEAEAKRMADKLSIALDSNP